MNKLIQELETLPAFLALKAGLKEATKENNFWLHQCDYDINKLMDDEEYFEKWLLEDCMRRDVIEFMKAIIKEIRI